jgi:hypothetical protein
MAGSQGQPASVRAGCCSARGHEGWLLLSQGSEGGLGQSPRQMVGWDPAGRAGGRLLRSMRNETSSGAGGAPRGHELVNCMMFDAAPLRCMAGCSRIGPPSRRSGVATSGGVPAVEVRGRIYCCSPLETLLRDTRDVAPALLSLAAVARVDSV